ncbi:MAG: tripartite tricarboxylate transporter TctB family protein [Candidatus Dactylopiibacterium sp.]|nr:tripartite tricarboxylate transporter TctB family protein [Candidatus Dactylopiibacterium sp.]
MSSHPETPAPAPADPRLLARIGRYSDFIVGGLLTLIGIATIVESRNFPATAVATDIGAGAFPTAFAILLIALCALLVFNAVQRRAHPLEPPALDLPTLDVAPDEAVPAEPPPTTGAEPPSFLRPFLGVVLTALYIAGIAWLGYLMATPLFMLAVLWLLGLRSPLTALLLTVGLTLALYLIFDVGMAVALPDGILFE